MSSIKYNLFYIFIALLFLGLLALTILYFVGLGYLTPIVAKDLDEDNKVCIKNLNKTRLDLIKLFIVLSWIGVAINITTNIQKN
jgi:hypothetical protein